MASERDEQLAAHLRALGHEDAAAVVLGEKVAIEPEAVLAKHGFVSTVPSDGALPGYHDG